MSSMAVGRSKEIKGGISVCFPQLGNLGMLKQHTFASSKIRSLGNCALHLTPTGSPSSVDLILKTPANDQKMWPCCDVRVEGLETLDYFDTLLQGKRISAQPDAITFDGEVDRTYMRTPANIAIMDHERKRIFVIQKEGLPDAGLPLVIYNPWDKPRNTRTDFGNTDYKVMLSVGSVVLEKPIVLGPSEEWKCSQELSTVSSSYCSGQLDPKKVLHGFS